MKLVAERSGLRTSTSFFDGGDEVFCEITWLTEEEAAVFDKILEQGHGFEAYMAGVPTEDIIA